MWSNTFSDQLFTSLVFIDILNVGNNRKLQTNTDLDFFMINAICIFLVHDDDG